HLILALLTDRDLARLALEISKEIHLVSVESLKKNFAETVAGSIEARESIGSNAEPGQVSESPMGSKTRALDQYTIDLTAKARRDTSPPGLARELRRASGRQLNHPAAAKHPDPNW